jgi:hypothetical protein
VSTRITDNLPKFVANVVPAKAARGVHQALIIGAGEASVLTPIGETTNLLNSQFRLPVRQEGSRVVGTVGYGAEYAPFVHDPEVKQNFRRESAEKEFLRKGFERSEAQIRRALAGSLK